MEEKTTTSLNLLIIFFLSYSFYVIQILTQELFYSYSKQSVIIICLFQLLFPLITYVICKIINSNKINVSSKNNFLFSLISSIYLIITAIICIVNITNIVVLYYYQQTSYIILLIFLSLPIIYTLIKGDNIFFYLASVLLIIYILFKYAYLKNSSSIDYYVFNNIFKIEKDNILPIIIYSLPILIEPIILISNRQHISNKINTKFVLIFSIIIAIVGVITTLRQTWEFGNLLDKIRFPYLESAKNIIAGKFFENIDFYYLLSIAASLYLRLSYTIITIKKSFSLNKIVSITLLIALLVVSYIIQRSMDLYIFTIDKALIITSTCLLLCFILLPFMIKRKVKENV